VQLDLWEGAERDPLLLERRALLQGCRRVAGIDEVGRGPLAGPVVAAAVVLPLEARLPGVRDSKRLSAARREACLQDILACALDVGVGTVEAEEIDRINILQATLKAMVQAVEALAIVPDHLLIDGIHPVPVSLSQQTVPQGDRRCLSISAASIVAKVHRDRFMCDQNDLYPAYGFRRHKGYGTREHLEALRRYGPCPLHRRSFRGVLPEKSAPAGGVP